MRLDQLGGSPTPRQPAGRRQPHGHRTPGQRWQGGPRHREQGTGRYDDELPVTHQAEHRLDQPGRQGCAVPLGGGRDRGRQTRRQPSTGGDIEIDPQPPERLPELAQAPQRHHLGPSTGDHEGGDSVRADPGTTPGRRRRARRGPHRSRRYVGGRPRPRRTSCARAPADAAHRDDAAGRRDHESRGCPGAPRCSRRGRAARPAPPRPRARPADVPAAAAAPAPATARSSAGSSPGARPGPRIRGPSRASARPWTAAPDRRSTAPIRPRCWCSSASPRARVRRAGPVRPAARSASARVRDHSSRVSSRSPIRGRGRYAGRRGPVPTSGTHGQDLGHPRLLRQPHREHSVASARNRSVSDPDRPTSSAALSSSSRARAAQRRLPRRRRMTRARWAWGRTSAGRSASSATSARARCASARSCSSRCPANRRTTWRSSASASVSRPAATSARARSNDSCGSIPGARSAYSAAATRKAPRALGRSPATKSSSPRLCRAFAAISGRS